MLDMLETVNQRDQNETAGVHLIAGFIESTSESRSWNRGDCVCEVQGGVNANRGPALILCKEFADEHSVPAPEVNERARRRLVYMLGDESRYPKRTSIGAATRVKRPLLMSRPL